MNFDLDTYYRFNNFARNYVATGNLMNFCETNSCMWILDCVISYAPQLQDKDYLQIVTVTRVPNSLKAVFKIEDEINGLLVEQHISYTDLEEDVKFWIVQQGDQWVCLLPSEY
jgi:hypothetical protein